MKQPEREIVEFKPQKGKQELFLASGADITIYGGAAGGGKTYGLCLEPLRHIKNTQFGAVYFRRSTKDIRAQGGLWDESQKIYPYFEGAPRETFLDWRFPSGSKVTFGHLEYDKTCEDYKSSQIPLICFDQLETFSEYQFWYMLSRSRTTCGIRPYIRATCNPDSESFLRQLLDYWIDNDTGLAIESRAGQVRYFVRVGEDIVFANSPKEIIKKHPEFKIEHVKSLSFIPAKLSDNKILNTADPAYQANLLALPMVERERLLHGNWNVAATGGVCKIEWFRRFDLDDMPEFVEVIQSWDTALKEKETNDYSVCTTWGITDKEEFYLIDCYIAKLQFPVLKKKAFQLASDYLAETSLIEDKASGTPLIQAMRDEGGLTILPINPKGDKVERFSRASIMIEAGRVFIPKKAHWLSDFELQLKSFPKSPNDDIVDSVSQFLNWYGSRMNKKLSIRRL